MTNKENALNWFEIAVSDISRAKKFYESVFDIQMDQTEMMVFIFEVSPKSQGRDSTYS